MSYYFLRLGYLQILLRAYFSDQKSKRGVKFVGIQAGENNSSFIADLSGIGDKTFAWNLDKGQSILGPFSNIREVVGELACFVTK